MQMKIVLVGAAAAMLALMPGATLRAQGVDTTGAGQSAPPAGVQRVVLCGSGFEQNVACGVRIAKVVDGGTLVELQDGTVWEVYLPNRPSTVTWRKGDYVLVQRNPLARGSYDYVIINGRAGYQDDTGARAFVRFRGAVPEQTGG
jgi:hypothetical protein